MHRYDLTENHHEVISSLALFLFQSFGSDLIASVSHQFDRYFLIIFLIWLEKPIAVFKGEVGVSFSED